MFGSMEYDGTRRNGTKHVNAILFVLYISLQSEWQGVRAITRFERSEISRNNISRSRNSGSSNNNRDSYISSSRHIMHMQCSVDASFFRGQNRTCVGCCIWGIKGQFVRAFTRWSQHNMLVHEGGVVTLLNAMNWVQKMGLLRVKFLSDS